MKFLARFSSRYSWRAASCFEINYRLLQTAVECLPKDQFRNHTDGVEEAYLHSSFQIHLDTLCSGLEEPQVP
jgi:hypothetical protein